MKLGRYDSFMIGLALAFTVANFQRKDYLGIAFQGIIIGIYFGIKFEYSLYHGKVKE